MKRAGVMQHWTPPAVFLLLGALFTVWFGAGGGAMDEGAVLLYPELVQKGWLPYRDFETFYGPANLWTLAGVYSLFGATIEAERAVGLLYRLLCIGAIFFLARRWGTAVATGAMALAGAVLLVTSIVASAWIGAVACALWALCAAMRLERLPRCFAAGLLAGLAVLFRPDIAPAIGLGLLPLVYRIGWRRLLVVAGGGALALLPFLWLAFAAGIEQVLNNLFIYPVLRSNEGRRLPLASADMFVLRLLFFHVAALLLMGIAAVLALRKRDTAQSGALLLALALFGLGITPQALGRLDAIHLLFSAFLTIALLPVALSIFAGARRIPAAIFPAAVAVAVCATSWPVAQLVHETVTMAARTDADDSPFFLEQHGRSFPVGSSRQAILVGRMLTKLDVLSKPGERLFVGPADLRRTNYADTYIYHLMPKLTPATYFLEMNPLSANRPDSRLASDVASADWLVLNRKWDAFNEPNRSRENGPEAPNAVVQEQFTVVGQYGTFELFRKKQPGSDGATVAAAD